VPVVVVALSPLQVPVRLEELVSAATSMRREPMARTE
jgi:hypothetical protein